MQDEKDQLEEKIEALSGFLSGNIFPQLTVDEQVLLRLQKVHMRSYLQVLSKRLQVAKQS